MGVVIHDGHPYSMPPDAIGLPGTLYLYRDHVRIVAGRFSAEHDAAIPAGRRLDPAGAPRPARRRGLGQARASLSAAPALARSRRRGAGLSHRAHPSAAADLDSRRRAAARAAANAWRCGAAHAPSSAASPSRRSAPSTSRTISGRPMPPLPFDDEDRPPTIPAYLAAARRPGPGRRRRPEGRSAAEPLDAAEHGGILSPRRRPVMIAAETDLDALFKRLHLANARRVWRDLVHARRARVAGPIATSSRSWPPRKSRIGSRRGSRD